MHAHHKIFETYRGIATFAEHLNSSSASERLGA
jgi:hypothetical protein